MAGSALAIPRETRADYTPVTLAFTSPRQAKLEVTIRPHKCLVGRGEREGTTVQWYLEVAVHEVRPGTRQDEEGGGSNALLAVAVAPLRKDVEGAEARDVLLRVERCPVPHQARHRLEGLRGVPATHGAVTHMCSLCHALRHGDGAPPRAQRNRRHAGSRKSMDEWGGGWHSIACRHTRLHNSPMIGPRLECMHLAQGQGMGEKKCVSEVKEGMRL